MRVGVTGIIVLLMGALGGLLASERRPSPLSPYEIHHRVSQDERIGVGDLWSRLGICETVHSHHAVCGTTLASNVFICKEGCHSELLLLDVLPDPGFEVVLRLSGIDAYYRFLVFRRLPSSQQGTGRWELVDHIDSGWSKYGEVTARASKFGGRRYLILSETAGGTGVGERYETWYEFGDSGAQEALSVSQKFHHAPLGVMWEAQTTFVSYEVESSAEALRFQMQIHYDNRVGQTFDRTVPIVYRRGAGEGKFKFDPAASDLAPEIAAAWHRIPEYPLQEEVWEYGVLLSVAGVPDELRDDWCDEFRERRDRQMSLPESAP